MICRAQPLADRRAPTQMKYFPPTHHGLLCAGAALFIPEVEQRKSRGAGDAESTA